MTKKDSTQKFLAVIAIIALLALTYVFVKFGGGEGNEGGIDRTQCPYSTEGNENASFVIKYIDSPYCVWCWFENSVLKEAIATKGDRFKLEKYDIRFCNDDIAKYGFSGTPSFVFGIDGKEFTHSGYIDEVNFFNVICKATGDCDIE